MFGRNLALCAGRLTRLAGNVSPRPLHSALKRQLKAEKKSRDKELKQAQPKVGDCNILEIRD